MRSFLTALALALAAPAAAQILEVQPRQQIVPANQPHTLLRTSNYLTQLSIPTDYTFQFNFAVGTRVNRNWQNVLHVTATGTNCCGYGTRIPGLWWRPNTRRFYMTDGALSSGGNNDCSTAFTFQPNTMYQVRIEFLSTMVRAFVNDTRICQETRRGRRSFNNALLYLSDPWYVAADAAVSDMWFQVNEVPANYGNWTFIGPSWVTMASHTSVGTIRIPLNYEIGFEIMPSNTLQRGWGNILQITGTGGSCCQYGDRIPAVWFYPNTRRFYFIDGHFNGPLTSGGGAGDDQCPYNTQAQPNVVTSVRMQLFTDNVTVFVNGQQVCTEPRNDRAIWNAATVWAANPGWTPAMNGQIRNLYLADLDATTTTSTVGGATAANAQAIATLSAGQAILTQGQSSITVAMTNAGVSTQNAINNVQSSVAAVQTSLGSYATSTSVGLLSSQTGNTINSISSAVTTLSNGVNQMSTNFGASIAASATTLSQIRANIAAAVQSLPAGNAPPPSTGSSPQVRTDSQGIHIAGNGASVILDDQCGSIRPCDLLGALNALRNI